MAFVFSVNQIEEIRSMFLEAEAGLRPYADVYRLVGDMIDSSVDNDVQRVEAWLRGAEQANLGQGIFSDIIREYTQIQGLLRIDSTFSPVNQQYIATRKGHAL